MSPLEGGAIHFLPLLPLQLLVLVVPPVSPLLAGVDYTYYRMNWIILSPEGRV